MTMRLVGAGFPVTKAGNVFTFANPEKGVGGDGKIDYAAGTYYLINRTQSAAKEAISETVNASDRNKITAVEVADGTGWLDTDLYMLATDNSMSFHGGLANANAALANGDTMVVYPKTGGNWWYKEPGQQFQNDNVIIESAVIGQFFIWTYTGTANYVELRGTTGSTFRDCIQVGRNVAANHSFAIFYGGGGNLIERCIAFGGYTNGFYTRYGANKETIRNCIAVGCSNGFYNQDSNQDVDWEFCDALYCNRGFKRISGTVTSNGCLGFLNSQDFEGTITGDYNGSSDATAPTGGHSLVNQTVDDLKLAHWNSPVDPVSQFPFDFRLKDGLSSSLEDAAVPIAGATLDIDGNTRDGSTPNIGASEGFPGFGEPVAVAPGQPKITAFSIGDGSITVTVDGDAGATNTLWYKIAGSDDDYTEGNNRVGDGDIVQSGLSNGTVYEVIIVSS